MRWKSARRAATVAAAATVMLGASMGTAMADAVTHIWDNYDHQVGSARFWTNGDNLTAYDGYPDGKAVVAFLGVNGRLYQSWALNGSGTSHTSYLDFPEGLKVDLQVCTGIWNPRTILDCSHHVSGTT
ncbi:hypothetical protein ACH35V_30080 [Actinomadura sp. 1N219]|uniref:hypothetical protein n=1 Tax=Actinomadura sp. 1N219 TaxID=3375152 RepID=UPI0037B51C5B